MVMEVKVLFPPSKEIADLMTTICGVAMRSTRTKKSAHELLFNHEVIGLCDDIAIRHTKTEANCKRCRVKTPCSRKLLLKAKKFKHWGVFEHAYFTVSVSGVSRALTHQLVRHRQNSFLQQSQKQVEIDVSKYDWYVEPHSIDTTGKTLSQKQLSKILSFDMAMQKCAEVYKTLLSAGIDEEDARYALPNACKTNIVITANARQWLHFFYMRLSEHAQWEIREMCKAILNEFMKLSPIMFEGAGKLEV